MTAAADIASLALQIYLVVVALLLGSFIGLAADRLPRRESVVRPRSHCRSCGRRLNMWDLLPVAGYLLRRGRCATCGSPIGVYSVLIEALCGSIMLVSLLSLGLFPGALVGMGVVGAVGLTAVGTALSPRRSRAGR